MTSFTASDGTQIDLPGGITIQAATELFNLVYQETYGGGVLYNRGATEWLETALAYLRVVKESTNSEPLDDDPMKHSGDTCPMDMEPVVEEEGGDSTRISSESPEGAPGGESAGGTSI